MAQYEHAETVADVDGAIRAYQALSPEEQRDQWLLPEYVTAFPSIAARLLSSKGLEDYPAETRGVFFEAARQAFMTYPLGRRKRYQDVYDPLRQRTTRQLVAEQPIACSDFVYDIDTGQSKRATSTGQMHPDNLANLAHIDLAGVIALGMSLPERDEAMASVVEVAARGQTIDTIKDHISLMLPTNSVARAWVLRHGLAAASGLNWDETIARLVFSFPDHVIKAAEGRPHTLPSELTMSQLHEYYSPEAMSIFLEYAAAYAGQMRLTPSASRELIDFTLWVRKMPGGFLRDLDRQIDLLTVLAATNSSFADSAGRAVNAREYLGRYAPHRSRERLIGLYNRGVQELTK